MLGMILTHELSGISGKVDSVSVDPEGKGMVRIEDHWFMAEECEG